MVNKADLLAESAELEDPAELEPSGASSADTLLLDRSQSNKGPAQGVVRDDATHQMSHDIGDGEHAGSRELRREDDSTDEGLPDLSPQESTRDLEESYDVQPRDINANLEWLQQQRTRMGASAAMLTSAVTGQGLHELMLAINAMLERRQGSVAVEHRTAASGDPPDIRHPQKGNVGQQQGRVSVASRAA